MLTVEFVPISKVFLSPSNPRINDDAVPHVAASIRRFGFQQPLVAKHSGEIVAANTRLKAAQSLGITEVPVVWFEGSELDATACAIADNKTHEFASWDEDALSKILVQLRSEDSLEGIGYSSDDNRDPECESWALPTSSNPHVSADDIEAERARLTPDVFAQQYEAKFIGVPLGPCIDCGGRVKISKEK